ncbi:hypothetical protein SDJN02_21043 [Cucurbita argyrosperma subsp. argyrosperma]|nr:hypothetical protein SDJN02_21043 [Cucurbita argyrosperma subsp. argyrosperma]
MAAAEKGSVGKLVHALKRHSQLNNRSWYLTRVAAESEVVCCLAALSGELSPKSSLWSLMGGDTLAEEVEEEDDPKEELVSKIMDSGNETPPLPKSVMPLASFSPITPSASKPTKQSCPFCKIFAPLSASTNQASVLG